MSFGDPEERIEGQLKVSGRALYTADVHPPGMLWARYLLSPYPHARIVSIDTDAARAVRGVHAVLTGADIGPARMGRALMDWPALACGKVRFVGERVAAVAAETPEAADAAVQRIVVQYEELPALLDPSSAIMPDAPILHPDSAEYTFLPGTRPPVPHPNVQGFVTVRKGTENIDEAFGAAHRIFEHVFRTSRQHTGYIEPHGALVWIDSAGVVHIVCTNKAPFVLRRQFSAATGVPSDRIVVEPTYIGGDFGGKGLSLDEVGAYFLSRASGRPVRSMVSYVEDMQNATTRHAAVIRLRTGVDAEGRFVAHTADVLLDGGAYAAGKALPSLVPIGAVGTLGPYYVPHVSITLSVVYTNSVPAGHMRAPGEVQAQFAGESHVDMIARELGMDPLEFRLRNALRPGQNGPANERFRDVRAVELLEALKQVGPGRARGRGVALAVRGIFQAPTSVRLRLEQDGRIALVTGVPEQGSGMHTMLRRVAAAALGVDQEFVTIMRGNTSEAPSDPGASASWVTIIAGQAAARGAVQLKARLEELAAELRGWPADEVELRGNWFHVRSSGERSPFLEVAQQIARGGEVIVDGVHEAPPPGSDGDANFAAYMADVDVDVETGAIDVRDVVLAMDAGAIINPIAHQGQLDGSFMFGLGAALMEELVVSDGRPVNANMADYKLPTQMDMPAFKTILLSSPTGPGPFGAKAAGEVANSAVAPAIANAVADATGARVLDLPLTPERVLAAIRLRARS